MGFTRRQFVLASTLIAAAMILGCAQARAGYVAVPSLADQGNGCSLAQTPLAESEASATMAGDSSTSSQPTSGEQSQQVPLEPPSPSRRLLHLVCDFGHGSGAGNSSSSGPSNGPSGSPVSDLQRPQLPQLELSSLLPPQKESAHPFSVASFLFRPPRAA